jgi:hypothetical protein
MTRLLLVALAAATVLAAAPASAQMSDGGSDRAHRWQYPSSGFVSSGIVGYRNYDSAFDYADCPLVQVRSLTPRGTTVYRTFRICN